MFRAVIQGYTREWISKDFHFRFGDTDDFVSPYFTMEKPEW